MKIDDLTLVVPIRDRHKHLPIVAYHYKDLECKKIIFDTSKTQYDKIPMLESAGFEYIYEGPTPYPEVFYNISKIIKTDFVVDCPDDDMLLLSSLQQSVDFLKENKDYVVCDGEYLYFDKRTNALFPRHPNKFFGQLKEQFHSTSATERLRFWFDCNMSRCPSVIRSDTYRFIWDVIYKNPQFHPISFNDRVHGYITTLIGNAKTLPVVYQIRNWEPGTSIQDNPELFEELQRDVQMADCLDEHHLTPMVNLLVERDNISFKEALELSITLLKNQLAGGGDDCAVDTSNWEHRDGRHRHKHRDEMLYICQLMRGIDG